MKITRAKALQYIPASHENKNNPGVYKKVLVKPFDVQRGNLQMINWSKMPPGKSFRKHYHEDLEEVFLMIDGTAELVCGDEAVVLERGDCVCIPPGIVHSMKNLSENDVLYIVVGIASGKGGKTVAVQG